MLQTFRAQNNRLALRAFTLVVMVCWLSSLVTSLCPMPVLSATSAEVMNGCPGGVGIDHHADDDSGPDCATKLCFANVDTSISTMPSDPLEAPVLLLFVLVFGLRPSTAEFLSRPASTDPPPGRRIPLIYRFCSLLN